MMAGRKSIQCFNEWDAVDVASMFVESCNEDLMDPAREELQFYGTQPRTLVITCTHGQRIANMFTI